MEQSTELVVPVGEDVAGGTADDLLAACLSLRPAAPRPQRLAQLTAAEWELLAQRAISHGVAPLLHSTLSDDPGVAVPEASARALEADYRATARANARMYDQLTEFGAALQAAGIRAVVLKGAYVARGLYGDPALRPMDDIDLLLPRAEVRRAERLLLELGYHSQEHPGLETSFARNHHLVPLVKAGCSQVELHWSIDALGAPRAGGPPVSPFTLDLAGVWARARPAGIPGTELLSLSPEDLLLHLCLHSSFHHGFNISLLKLCDIGWAARRGVDWERVEATAREWRAVKLVAPALRLSREVLDAPIPPTVLAGAGWTPGDERVFSLIRRFVLRRADVTTAEHMASRRAINLWLAGVTGMLGRGAE